jgi:hypothetical protein
MRRLARVLVGAVVGLAVLGCAVYVSDPWFWKRIATFPGTAALTDAAWYQPSEAVPGAAAVEFTVAAADRRSIDAAALDAALSYATQTQSLALLVWHGGALQLEQYWGGQDVNSTTDSGALHTTLLALLYGAAIEDGVIHSLDEPVATYLPEWRADAHARIRVRDLLQMSSGLEHWQASRNPWNRARRLLFGGHITPLVLGAPVRAEPGTQFEFNNADAELLGIALQRAAGKRYARYLSERLWSRLGTRPAAVWLDSAGGMARTFCCLQASARDWLAVGLLILNQGRVGSEQVVPAAWIAEMLQPSTANPHFGLETWLGDARFLAPDVAILDGGGQRVYIVPSRQLVIVRVGARRADWDEARLPNAILRGVS